MGRTDLKTQILHRIDFRVFYPEGRDHGNERMVRCPFHEDLNPSLAVNLKDGRWMCHGCGAKGDVFTWQAHKMDLDISTSDWKRYFTQVLESLAAELGIEGSEPQPRRKRQPRQSQDGLGKLEATYSYQDENGVELFEVRKYRDDSGKKTFRQLKPDGNGEYLPSIAGIRRVLYRLPKLLAGDDPVLLCEGEKDVETARNLGFTATCNPMGAGKWEDGYGESLRGRDVVAIPHNDDEGRKHMAMVGRRISGVVKRFRVVELPVPNKGGDLTDWERAGGTAEELRALVEAAEERTSPEPDLEYTDTGNALRFREQHGDKVRWCKKFGEWVVWDGGRWVVDDEAARASTLAVRTARGIYREAAAATDAKQSSRLATHATRSLSGNRLREMLRVAQMLDGMAVAPGDFDQDPWLLNTPTGTLELKTGTLLGHRREDFIRKITRARYNPHSEGQRWNEFLLQIMGGDEEIVQYLGRCVGYALTGDVSEQVMFILWGAGANGKSTFLNALLDALGDYAVMLPSELLMLRRNREHETELTQLQGRRLAVTIEVEIGKQLAPARVKTLTGGDPITARRLYQNHYTFDPVHKIFLACNSKPRIPEASVAMWRRIKLIPFTQTFQGDEQEKDLLDKLKREREGILRWAVLGCLDWLERGKLDEPGKVTEATQEYETEQDVLADFFQECVVLDPHGVTPFAEVYAAYLAWCDRVGEPEENRLGKRAFGERLSLRGLLPTRKGKGGKRAREGLRLREPWETSKGKG